MFIINKRRLLKFLVSEVSFKPNLSFMLQLFLEQKICKPDFSDISILCFSKDEETIKNLLKQDFDYDIHITPIETTPSLRTNVTLAILPLKQDRLSIKQKLLLKRIKTKTLIYTAFVPAPSMLKKVKSWTVFAENCVINFH